MALNHSSPSSSRSSAVRTALFLLLLLVAPMLSFSPAVTSAAVFLVPRSTQRGLAQLNQSCVAPAAAPVNSTESAYDVDPSLVCAKGLLCVAGQCLPYKLEEPCELGGQKCDDGSQPPCSLAKITSPVDSGAPGRSLSTGGEIAATGLIALPMLTLLLSTTAAV